MKALHVLILDQDVMRREALAQLLRQAGHRTILAGDPAEAARALDVPGIDVLVLDLGSPGLDPAALHALLDPGEPAPPGSLEAAERRHIAKALRYTHGNKRRTAHLLGIARSTLLAKVRRYGLADIGEETPDSNGLPD